MQRAWEIKGAYKIFVAKSDRKTLHGKPKQDMIILNWIVNKLDEMERAGFDSG
jgi:hypothetical protein